MPETLNLTTQAHETLKLTARVYETRSLTSTVREAVAFTAKAYAMTSLFWASLWR